MENVSLVNLVWAIIWAVVGIGCVVAIWWNPSHFLTAAVCLFFAALHFHDYRKTKGM